MAQTVEGAIKVAAKKAGVTVAEYRRKKAKGLKWCTKCKTWHPESSFGRDSSRYDRLSAKCRESSRAVGRAAYQPKPRPAKGRSFVPARDGDKLQARRRVNHFVEVGLLPNPNDLPCLDCGHRDSDRRHEYDHYLGYAAEHHEAVQAVCTTCHHRREGERNGGQD